jgi:hypothetical protein
MALVVKDRVREISTSTGTGTFTLGGAVSGFQSFTVIGDGNTTYYAIVDAATGAWEVGIGTYTASGTTLTRNTILESSTGGTAVSFAAGTKDVFVTYPAERSVYSDASGIVSGYSIAGGSVNNTPIGNTTASTGAFTDFSASGAASFTSTGSVKIPVGTTAQRPTPVAGMLRFNDDTDEFEGYNGTAWASVGGSAISNDTSTATDLYPAFLNATTGTAASIFTSNAKLLYKPSTGELKSEVLVAQNGLVVNSTTIDTSYTIATGFGASSVGPITVADGVSVTVNAGSRWVIQ